MPRPDPDLRGAGPAVEPSRVRADGQRCAGPGPGRGPARSRRRHGGGAVRDPQGRRGVRADGRELPEGPPGVHARRRRPGGRGDDRRSPERPGRRAAHHGRTAGAPAGRSRHARRPGPTVAPGHRPGGRAPRPHEGRVRLRHLHLGHDRTAEGRRGTPPGRARPDRAPGGGRRGHRAGAVPALRVDELRCRVLADDGAAPVRRDLGHRARRGARSPATSCSTTSPNTG